jgi:hypothetical protein
MGSRVETGWVQCCGSTGIKLYKLYSPHLVPLHQLHHQLGHKEAVQVEYIFESKLKKIRISLDRIINQGLKPGAFQKLRVNWIQLDSSCAAPPHHVLAVHGRLTGERAGQPQGQRLQLA